MFPDGLIGSHDEPDICQNLRSSIWCVGFYSALCLSFSLSTLTSNFQVLHSILYLNVNFISNLPHEIASKSLALMLHSSTQKKPILVMAIPLSPILTVQKYGFLFHVLVLARALALGLGPPVCQIFVDQGSTTRHG